MQIQTLAIYDFRHVMAIVIAVTITIQPGRAASAGNPAAGRLLQPNAIASV